MNRDFEINLMNGSNLLMKYNWYAIPNVGDKLLLSDNRLFTVMERILPTTESVAVILFGKI